MRKRFASTVIFASLLSACATLAPMLSPPNVSLVGLELNEIGLFEQRYSVRLRVQNPNQTALPIKGLNYEIFINDKHFATGSSNEPVEVPALGEALTSVTVSTSTSAVLNQLKLFAEDQNLRFNYRVKGNVVLSSTGISLPFDRAGEFGLPEDKSTKPSPTPQAI